jgi:hypothetical protein
MVQLRDLPMNLSQLRLLGFVYFCSRAILGQKIGRQFPAHIARIYKPILQQK